MPSTPNGVSYDATEEVSLSLVFNLELMKLDPGTAVALRDQLIDIYKMALDASTDDPFDDAFFSVTFHRNNTLTKKGAF